MHANHRALATCLVLLGIALVILALLLTLTVRRSFLATSAASRQVKTASLARGGAVFSLRLTPTAQRGDRQDPRTPSATSPRVTASSPTPSPPASGIVVEPGRPVPPRPSVRPAAAPAAATPTVVPTSTPSLTPRPITRLAIPSIGFASRVVPAPLRRFGTVWTWEVPPFAVGHGQYTAGAGELGVAVLFGHVASQSAGSVFQSLHRANVGDVVEVDSGAQRFDYRIVEKLIVSPENVTVLRPVGRASLVLITCAGVWLPGQRDYSERLVLRAVLVS